jgi:hypothetical protein
MTVVVLPFFELIKNSTNSSQANWKKDDFITLMVRTGVMETK